MNVVQTNTFPSYKTNVVNEDVHLQENMQFEKTEVAKTVEEFSQRAEMILWLSLEEQEKIAIDNAMNAVENLTSATLWLLFRKSQSQVAKLIWEKHPVGLSLDRAA